MVNACRDCGVEADPSFTMDFTDVEPGAFIHWCASCGPEAQAMNEMLTEALREDPGFAKRFEAALDEAELKIQ